MDEALLELTLGSRSDAVPKCERSDAAMEGLKMGTQPQKNAGFSYGSG